jgi:hypothetical protein
MIHIARVAGKKNLADLFAKILPLADQVNLSWKILYFFNVSRRCSHNQQRQTDRTIEKKGKRDCLIFASSHSWSTSFSYVILANETADVSYAACASTSTCSGCCVCHYVVGAWDLWQPLHRDICGSYVECLDFVCLCLRWLREHPRVIVHNVTVFPKKFYNFFLFFFFFLGDNCSISDIKAFQIIPCIRR